MARDLQKITLNGVFELWYWERYPKEAFWISVFNILLRGTPKVRWRMKKHPFLKENVDDAVWLKSIPFRHFFLDTGA